VHLAHLRLAQEAWQACALSVVRFIPSARPPHREKPGASAGHRLRMVELAIRCNPAFQVDDRELRRSAASYTIDTVEDMRAELGPVASLCLIVGADAFALFETWKRWRELLDLVHLIVAHRPGFETRPASPALAAEFDARLTQSRADLAASAAGRIHPVAITPLGISATRIRGDLRAGLSARYLLPDSVLGYIESNGLYGSSDGG
jgi:nicotinate-nucleotide adenylyltransferase